MNYQQFPCSYHVATRNFSTPAAAAAPVAVSPALIKSLRTMTGSPMMECRNAIASVYADPTTANLPEVEVMNKAVEWLRKKGAASASKKSGRTAAEGLVAVGVNEQTGRGYLVELNSETDFVARNEQFQLLIVRIVDTCLAQPTEVMDKMMTFDPTSGFYNLDLNEFNKLHIQSLGASASFSKHSINEEVKDR
jgi:translation elongation factor EF-Ts